MYDLRASQIHEKFQQTGGLLPSASITDSFNNVNERDEDGSLLSRAHDSN
jgi:hypothetical protein